LISGDKHVKHRNLKAKTWGTLYLFIANFFATEIIGGSKELVVLL
jgi:hypothetical protein